MATRIPSHAKGGHCALARANRGFYTYESNNSPGLLLYKIADCVRMCFSSARNR